MDEQKQTLDQIIDDFFDLLSDGANKEAISKFFEDSSEKLENEYQKERLDKFRFLMEEFFS